MIKSYVLQTLISKMPRVNLIDNLRVIPSKHLIEFTYQGHILKVFRPNPDGPELKVFEVYVNKKIKEDVVSELSSRIEKIINAKNGNDSN